MRRRATAGLSLTLIVLGVVAVARTLQAGVGGGLGLVHDQGEREAGGRAAPHATSLCRPVAIRTRHGDSRST